MARRVIGGAIGGFSGGAHIRATRLVGLQESLRAFNTEAEKIKGRCLKGLIRAQAVLRDRMDSVPPKIPVISGNLRKTWFCVTSNGAVISGRSPSFDLRNASAGRVAAEHSTLVAEQAAIAATRNYPSINFGFSAFYATYVHENYSGYHRRPGSGPKFFETHLKALTPQMLKIIAENARIPG